MKKIINNLLKINVMKNFKKILAKFAVNYIEYWMLLLNFVVAFVLYSFGFWTIGAIKISIVLFLIAYPFFVKFNLRSVKSMKERKELIDYIEKW